MTPDRTITEVRKQAPTPINKVVPKEAHPLKVENPNEPNANIVVIEINNIALPVLENILNN